MKSIMLTEIEVERLLSALREKRAAGDNSDGTKQLIQKLEQELLHWNQGR